MATPIEPLNLTILFREDGDQVVAQIKEVPAALSFGPTREDARESVIDALRELVASYIEQPPGTPSEATSEDSEAVAIHAELR